MAGSDVLVWMDMEMTGLDPAKERIIEVATILTDGQLVEIAVGPDLVIHQADDVLAAMDDWNKKHHGGSGLIERVKASTVTDGDAEAQTLEFIKAHVGAKDRPVLAGNSIHQDRRFIRRYMPALDGGFRRSPPNSPRRTRPTGPSTISASRSTSCGSTGATCSSRPRSPPRRLLPRASRASVRARSTESPARRTRNGKGLLR